MSSKLIASNGNSEQPRIVRKTVNDVWREIVAERKSEQQPKEEMMTLEDFLYKAEEGDGAAAVMEAKEEGLSGIGRGKRSLSLSEPLDKAAEQRERRMIKNRESAARSRERKQAYEAELEWMAVRLEEENDGLLKEKEEHTKKRLKQLMENVIPVTEKRRPPRILQKVGSLQW